MNEFWAILAGALLTTLPVAPAPSVTVTYSDVETAVTSYLQTEDQTEVKVECGTGMITISPDTDFTKTCEVTNVETTTVFDTDITLHVTEKIVSVKAVILVEDAAEVQ